MWRFKSVYVFYSVCLYSEITILCITVISYYVLIYVALYTFYGFHGTSPSCINAWWPPALLQWLVVATCSCLLLVVAIAATVTVRPFHVIQRFEHDSSCDSLSDLMRFSPEGITIQRETSALY